MLITDKIRGKIMDRIKDIKLFLFDMDGTLYLGDRLFEFTKELLEKIRQSGADYLFMTIQAQVGFASLHMKRSLPRRV